MKCSNRWIEAAIGVALVLPHETAAKDDVRVSVFITIAKQDDSPVQIVGFKLPVQAGGLPAIVVRNRTSKEIRYVGFMNYLGNPRGAGGAEPKPSTNLGMTGVRLRPVAPNASTEFSEEVLKPYDVGSWAHRLRSNCLHAAFYVSRVDFADDTVWVWDEHEPGQFEPVRARLLEKWQDSIRPESTKGCDDSPATQAALGRLSGTGWPPPGGDGRAWPALPEPPRANIDPLPFFAFSCTIRDDTAFCGF